MALIAHISDVHLGPLPSPRPRELMSKRMVGYYNWQRNRERVHAPEVLAAIVADIKAARPDHIAVTGDLVNIGLPDEYRQTREWLEILGSPQDVSVVPGNHDAYVRSSMARFAEAWQPWMTGDTPGERPFPYIRRRGQLALIGVSTAAISAPFMATGRVDTEQAQALGLALAATGREGLCRVVMIHHPPVHRREFVDAAADRRRSRAPRDPPLRRGAGAAWAQPPHQRRSPFPGRTATCRWWAPGRPACARAGTTPAAATIS